MVPVGGDVAEARCQRRYRTVSEYPHSVGERLVNKISVIVLKPARNLSEERCNACPGRRGTAVSWGKARVVSASSRAFGPLTSRQDQPLTSRQDQWEEATVPCDQVTIRGEMKRMKTFQIRGRLLVSWDR